MIIEEPAKEELANLLSVEGIIEWNGLIEKIEELYDVDQIWNKGFGCNGIVNL